jgi:hypothetical protein
MRATQSIVDSLATKTNLSLKYFTSFTGKEKSANSASGREARKGLTDEAVVTLHLRPFGRVDLVALVPGLGPLELAFGREGKLLQEVPGVFSTFGASLPLLLLPLLPEVYQADREGARRSGVFYRLGGVLPWILSEPGFLLSGRHCEQETEGIGRIWRYRSEQHQHATWRSLSRSQN